MYQFSIDVRAYVINKRFTFPCRFSDMLFEGKSM